VVPFACWLARLLARSITHSLTHPLAHSLTHPLTHSLTRLLGRSLTCSPHYWLARFFTFPSTCCRFLLISVREGTQPTNQLWYVDLQALPEFSKDAALDFTPYDYNTGPKALPVVKLVDNFGAAYDYVANECMVFTFQTNYQAPLYRYASLLSLF